MVTIYDIASKCGVAPATVSKVMNNYRGVSKKTYERVMKAANELNYLPNTMAKYLSAGESRNIGVLIYINDSFPSLKHLFFMSILEYFKETLEQMNYDITLISRNFENAKGSYLNHCLMRKMDGVLVFGDYTNPRVSELMNSDLPIVAFDCMNEKVENVTSDHWDKMYEMTKYLIMLGHRDIIFIHGEHSFATDLRIDAFRTCFADNGLPFDERINLREGRYYDKDFARRVTKEIILGRNRPTALMYPDDYTAIYGYATAYDLKVKIPEELSITGCDGIEFSKMMKPSLTTVEQNVRGIANELAKKLVAKIEDPQLKTNTTVVKANFVQGHTCSRPAK